MRSEPRTMQLVNTLSQRSQKLRDRIEGLRQKRPFHDARRGLETVIMSLILGHKFQGMTVEDLEEALIRADPRMGDTAFCARTFGYGWKDHLVGPMRVSRLVDRAREQIADRDGVHR